MLGVYARHGTDDGLERLVRHIDASHLKSHPFMHHAIAEAYEERDDREPALARFRKAYATGVATDDADLAEMGLHGIIRVAKQDDRPSPEVARALALVGLIEQNGVRRLRPARNDACLCESGRKFKHCCG